MNTITSLLNEMKVINDKAASSDHRYTVLTVDTTKLNTLIRHHTDVANFCKAYELSKLNRVSQNDNTTKIYIEKSEDTAHIQQLMDDLSGAIVDEFYGLVQFDGDEPEAQGYYNSDYTNDPNNPLSMNIVPTRKRKMRMRNQLNVIPVDSIGKDSSKDDKSDKENESTEASDVSGTHIGSVNIIRTISDEPPALPTKQVRLRHKKPRMRVEA